jgi:hypothetical protein
LPGNLPQNLRGPAWSRVGLRDIRRALYLTERGRFCAPCFIA